MVYPMFRQVPARFVALIAIFTFCQVIGIMCALPDLSQAQEVAFIEDRKACPMDGTIMCPPSLISSPERQAKHVLFTNLDHLPVLHSPVPSPMTESLAPTPWGGSSALSIVPISIGSSPVLRI